ncbi:hypothetical protein TcasGA2_TC001716 [Tribolium castaneum]|uniref:Uncharacterized protein n=1 Tax=Tribolium castaneum TaxID=7070 RepID=D6W898_TRICA|nr:hypothetical protein TcasGA2_TC001716 [Tribolium castaneum]
MNLFAQRFPNRQYPRGTVVKRPEWELRRNWRLCKRRKHTDRTLDNEARLIAYITQNQKESARLQFVVLGKNKFSTYHVQLVRELRKTEFERRLEFCLFIGT